MKILLVYPQHPDTFWSFKHALKFVGKKAALPPLGLLTVAAMLPREWEKKLVDMNTATLSDSDIRWADYVFMSAMVVQRESAKATIQRCHRLGVKVVAGGPLFTTGHQDFEEVDHLVLGEAECTLQPFLEDLKNGCARRLYSSGEFPAITGTPVPAWELVDINRYNSMSIQYSRGCPFNCEFCDIVVLNGRVPRTKEKDQVLRELDVLYSRGWRAGVFVVDDNFIANKRKLKDEILPALAVWMKERGHPFSFGTQASINLSDDEELMRLMIEANFNTVFVGIETPHAESLAECGKSQNKNRDLMASIKRLQQRGLEVQGGFIVGFDSDPPSIFESQISFIQKSGIVTAMVGLLNAPRGSELFRRMKAENRLLNDVTGDNTDCSMNFVPRMDRETLMNGYRRVISAIYAPKPYYARLTTFLKEYKPPRSKAVRPRFGHIAALAKSVWFLGLKEKGRGYYWKLVTWTLVKRPGSFSLSLTMAVYGYHFRKIAQRYTGS